MAELLSARTLEPAALRGRTGLLVLQPTPFCNLDCSYCYLPARNDRRRMRPETVGAAVRFVVESGLARTDLTLAWHAGEPLVLPVTWYREAMRAASAAAAGRCLLTQAVQSNGVLLDEAWIDYIEEAGIRFGLSIDGPAAIHDAQRRRRDGGATHAEVMRAVERLHRRRIPFHAIAVVTAATLANPEGFCEFFEELGVIELGLNFEENEGVHRSSTLLAKPDAPALHTFLAYVVDRCATRPGLRIRELRRLLRTLRNPCFDEHAGNDENTPFAIVSVDAEGWLSTFSPELLGQRDAVSDGYVFGNVHTHRLSDVLASAEFQRIAAAVALGVDRCRDACVYFRLCHGGAPANKAAELGRLDGTVTAYCRTSVQALADAGLARLERDLIRRRAAQLRTSAIS